MTETGDSAANMNQGSAGGVGGGEATGGVPLNDTVGPCNWTLFRSIPSINLRNGDPSEMSSILIRATIPQAYHWVPIQNLNPANGVKAVDGFIRSEMAHFADHPPENLNETQRRKAAIVLGTVRAVSTGFYRLTGSDFIPGEVTQPQLTAHTDTEGDITYTVSSTVTPAARAVLNAGLSLTDVEVAAICQIIKCAAGVIPMQGYSLIMTNHHYLSGNETQSRKVYAVAEKAYWKSSDCGSWFSDDTNIIQDIAWHKAAHPVSIDLKMSSAMDANIASNLASVGAGACASRLPATESEIRAANSYITLFSTVSPMFKMFDGDIKMDDFTNLVNGVKTIPRNPNPMFDHNIIPQTYRPLVTDRASGLAMIATLVKQNADSAALCYGFYTALTESSATLGASTTAGQDTLKSSFSLSKLKSQSHASYVAGTELFRDYQSVRNQRRANGIFDAPSLVIA